MSQSLIARMLGMRESWFALEGSKRLKLRRPAEMDLPELRRGITIEHLKAIVVGWDGFVESDLLGSAVGSDTPVPFDADVMALALSDRSDWFAATAKEVMRIVMEHLQKKVDTAKN